MGIEETTDETMMKILKQKSCITFSIVYLLKKMKKNLPIWINCLTYLICSHTNKILHNSIANKLLENIDSIKDLGVTFDSYLKFGLHISDWINKAYSISRVIKINFSLLDRDSFLVIYKSMVRSHLHHHSNGLVVNNSAFIAHV